MVVAFGFVFSRVSSRLGCQVVLSEKLDGMRATLPPGECLVLFIYSCWFDLDFGDGV